MPNSPRSNATARRARSSLRMRRMRTWRLGCAHRDRAGRGARPGRFSPELWTRGEFGFRNLPEFLDIIREVTHQGLIDIMLMSAYVNEQLTIKEGLFKNSHVTPAAR